MVGDILTGVEKAIRTLTRKAAEEISIKLWGF
jgi:hypothetical protein